MTMLSSQAEANAEKATKLESFPINLPEIKRTVESILSLFGKNLLFSEYTTHDISHINDMISTLDWMIPDDTKQSLTDGEWLTIVLSIYFHDMGLVVTEEEFNNRNVSRIRRILRKNPLR